MTIFVLVLGMIIGSFLNVCIYRIPKEESIAFPPSHCMGCNSKIKPYDLIPVISYIVLKGKCRNCSQKISIRYPLIELLAGVLTMSIYLKFGFGLEFVKYSLMVFWLIVIGIIDLDTTDIYFKTTASGILMGSVFIIVGYFLGFGVLNFILGGIAGGGVIALIVLLTGGMGWGDVEVFLLGGLFLGFKLTLVALFIAFILGGLIGALLILTKKKSRKDYIPFAPYISLGLMLAMLFGDWILRIYLGA